MFGLSVSQLDAIGFTFVLNQLSPDSPYGIDRKKQIAPFSRQSEHELTECFDNLEKLIAFMQENGSAIEEVRAQLSLLKNIRGSIAKCAAQTLNQIDMFEIKNFLLTFEKLHAAFTKINDTLNLSNITLNPMNDALFLLDPDGSRIAAFTVDSEELTIIRSKKLHIEALLQKETDEASKKNLTAQRYALVQNEDEEEARVLQELTHSLRTHLPAFTAALDAIGLLDLTMAKAHLALTFKAVRPEISSAPVLSFTNMSNPYVEHTLSQLQSQQNLSMTKVSLTMEKGVTIITGANMGGKSVSMKTAVLNALLCQTGFFVFAEKASVPLFDGMYLISDDMQNVKRGLSSFGAEIVELNKITERVKKDFLFIALDEFASTTNPEEGSAIVRALAAYLAASASICVMSTHYDNVVTQEYKHYQVAGLTLPDALNTTKAIKSDPSFIAAYMDYTLLEMGSAASPPKDALAICKLLGLDSEIVKRIEREYL